MAWTDILFLSFFVDVNGYTDTIRWNEVHPRFGIQANVLPKPKEWGIARPDRIEECGLRHMIQTNEELLDQAKETSNFMRKPSLSFFPHFGFLAKLM